MCVYTLVSCTCHPHGSKLGLAFALNVPMMVISKKQKTRKRSKKNCKPFKGDAENTPMGHGAQALQTGLLYPWDFQFS